MKLDVLKLSAVACGLILGSLTPSAEASDLAGHHSSGTRAGAEERASQGQASMHVGAARGNCTDSGKHAQTPSQRTNCRPPYPFTREQFWKKMLEVAALPDGYVTRSDVERIFGIKLTRPDEKTPEDSKLPIYRVAAGLNWYFDMSVHRLSATQAWFYFQWGQLPGTPVNRFTGRPPLPTGMCINPASVLSGFEAAGWTFTGKGGEMIPSGDGPMLLTPVVYGFLKHKRGVATVEFQEGCLANIMIRTTDHTQY